MHIEVHTTSESFEILRDEWDGLLARSASDTLFLTATWQRVCWAHFGAGALSIVALRHDGRLVGLAPMQFAPAATEAPATGRFAANKEVSDYLDFVFERGLERECADALVGWLASEAAPPWSRLELSNIVESSPNVANLVELSRARGWRAEVAFEDVCPIIALPDSFEAYLGSLDGRERREIQRKLRRASEDVSVAFASDRARLDADLDDFIRLMAASTFNKSDFMTPHMEKFFHELAREMFDAGRLELSFLEKEGERAAAYMNFVYGNVVLVFNSGLDPSRFAYLSPGQTLIVRLIEKAIADKRRAFDFLQGDEDYKHRLGGRDATLNTLVVER